METAFVLDTGSTDNVWTLDLVKRAGLQTVPTDPGTDHAGTSTPSWAVGDAGIKMSDLDLNIADVVAIEGPSRFRDWGLGGFLSPQHLHPAAWVVIDLVSQRFGLVEEAHGRISDWLRQRHPDLQPLTLARESADLLIVQAAIEPFPPVATMLNTGTESTEVAQSVVPTLRSSANRIRGRGVSGSEIQASEATGQVLTVGGVGIPVPVLLIRPEMPDPRAMIGMDVLAGSVLAFSATPAQPIRWLVAVNREARQL